MFSNMTPPKWAVRTIVGIFILGIWKSIEIIIWLATHIKIGVE